MKPELVVLDLDGPLLDGIDRHFACYSRILRQHGYPPIPREEYWAHKRQRGDRRELLHHSAAAAIYDEFLTAWRALIETPEMLALDRLQPHVCRILRDWKTAGTKLVLATMRNNRDGTIAQLQDLNLFPFIDDVFITGSSDAGGKAAAVGDHLKRASLHPDSVIWVGDTEADIHAAQSLGICVYAVTCGLRTAQLLRAENPDYVVSDLSEVCLH